MKTFGNRFKELRKNKKLTQDELAKQFNKQFNTTFNKSTISQYENDRRKPEINILENWADFFDVSVDYLLCRTDERNINKNLPVEFTNPNDALEFILRQKTLMAFGGYDASKLSDEELLDFANDLLEHLKLLSYKYNK